ncbi:MAG TPA: serine protease, partial [Kofleriaceae bacterium]|nr:serine protease [Kofleriaceae bacterium]
MTDSKKPDDAAKPEDSAASPEQVALDSKVGTSVPEVDEKPAPQVDEKPAPQPWPPVATPIDPDATKQATADDILDEVVLADSSAFGDDFMLADEMVPAVGLEPPAPAGAMVVPIAPVLSSPQEAALEAARIVSQMVDIESESGAVIAAAAAAGAAIEAAVAAQKAAAASAAATAASAEASNEVSPRASAPNLRVSELAAAGATHDPVTTVRLSRDRILQALASEDIAVPVPPGQRVRARTEPGIDPAADDAYEEFDPVAIAAAAIGRLRQRARTDLAELRVHYHRHDILVLLLAFVIIVIVGQVHKRLVTPPDETFSEHGLTFKHSTAWLKPEPLPLTAPRLVRDASGAQPTTDESLYHVELSAIGSQAKLEVLVDKKPAWSNIVTGLDLDRRSRWGELYSLDESSVRSTAGHDWLRTSYRYAHAEKDDVPRVDHALEYATIDRDQIYVITIFGSPGEISQIEEVLAPSLRVQSQTALPLVPETGRFAQKKYPNGVGRAFASTVMVVVADLVDGRLKARGGGSGVVVGAEGSILTNYHVLHDKDGRLHDTFIIGRFGSLDKAPSLQCAGRPNRSKLLREMDLALIKCDMDLDGRTWSPTEGGVWATLPEARAADIKMGQRLWVLGYPDVGGGGLRWSTGEVEGWTGEDGAQGKDFIKTDASITHGNSGGPVIDDNGRLVGIAAAFRTRMTAT